MAMIKDRDDDEELSLLLEQIKQRTHFFEPPENFDPLTAGPEQLREYGLPPLPDRIAQPEQYVFWEMLYSPPLRFVKAEFSFSPPDYQLTQRGPLLATGTRYETSPNWSGAYITPKQSRMFTEVHGGWQVPTPLPPGGAAGDGDYRSSTWIGLDGQRRYLNSSLPQIGTSQFVKVVNGQPTPPDISTWWQWWLRGQKGRPVNLALAVKPQDLVLCSLVVINAITVRFFIKNQTTGDFVSPFEETPPSPRIKRVSGATAEWIVERPTHFDDDGLYDLPNYNTVLFSNCLAVAAPGPGSSGKSEKLPGAKLINMFEVREHPHRIFDISVTKTEGDQGVATFYR
jgi:hypothetical protein